MSQPAATAQTRPNQIVEFRWRFYFIEIGYSNRTLKACLSELAGFFSITFEKSWRTNKALGNLRCQILSPILKREKRKTQRNRGQLLWHWRLKNLQQIIKIIYKHSENNVLLPRWQHKFIKNLRQLLLINFLLINWWECCKCNRAWFHQSI